VYSAYSAGEASGSDWSLQRIPASGGQAQPIPETADGVLPAISSSKPSRLAFVKMTSDTNIWRMAVPNGVPQKIISSTRADTAHRFSRDGGKLVFLSNRTGGTQMWLAESDGSHQRALLASDGASPQWSPDGSHIVFGGSDGKLAVVGVDGSALTRLTEGPSH